MSYDLATMIGQKAQCHKCGKWVEELWEAHRMHKWADELMCLNCASNYTCFTSARSSGRYKVWPT